MSKAICELIEAAAEVGYVVDMYYLVAQFPHDCVMVLPPYDSSEQLPVNRAGACHNIRVCNALTTERCSASGVRILALAKPCDACKASPPDSRAEPPRKGEVRQPDLSVCA